MKYLMVKPQYDNRRRADGGFYIQNELYTLKEAERCKVNKSFCVLLEVSKKDIYFFFGARFCEAKDVKKIY